MTIRSDLTSRGLRPDAPRGGGFERQLLYSFYTPDAMQKSLVNENWAENKTLSL
jgi:hypothetical protein